MTENERVHEPGRLGPVAEGQIELNRKLAQEAPDASREEVHAQQESLQREHPEAVHEAAVGQPTAQAAAQAARSDSGGSGDAGGTQAEDTGPPK